MVIDIEDGDPGCTPVAQALGCDGRVVEEAISAIIHFAVIRD
jgi:hypothetical protein